MIRMLRGRLESLGWTDAVIDAGGVGFRVFIPLSTRERLPAARGPGEVTLLVHTRVREDGIELFGFLTAEELAVFELLIQASGVGPKLALSTLSTLEPPAVVTALAAGDTETLQRVPGIGRRTAERLCVELRHKAEEMAGVSAAADAATAGPSTDRHPAYSDAVAALVSLGYARQEAHRAVRAATRQVAGGDGVEALVRRALSIIAGGERV